jgi:hypothetical protein
MKHLFNEGITRIWADDENLLIADCSAVYLYHLLCGGVKMFHLLSSGGVDSLEMTPLCRCHRSYVRFVERSMPDPVQQTLANVFVGLGSCRSVDDVRLMLEEMASREEMQNVEQAL